jgi:hypothetical protein
MSEHLSPIGRMEQDAETARLQHQAQAELDEQNRQIQAAAESLQAEASAKYEEQVRQRQLETAERARLAQAEKERTESERQAAIAERLAGSAELNDAAELRIYGSRGRTYNDSTTGEAVATPEHPLKGRVDEMRANPRYGKTEVEREAAAKGYLDEIQELVDSGLELTQAELIVEHERANDKNVAALTGKFIEQGMDAQAAHKKALGIYDKKEEQFESIVRNEGIMNEEQYREYVEGKTRPASADSPQPAPTPEPTPPAPEDEPEPTPPAPKPETDPDPSPDLPPRDDDTAELPRIEDEPDDDIDLNPVDPLDIDLDDIDPDPGRDNGSPLGTVYRGGKYVKENFVKNPEVAASYRAPKKKKGDKGPKPYVTLPIPGRINHDSTLSVEGRHAKAKEKLASISDKDLLGMWGSVAREMFPSDKDYKKFVAARDRAMESMGYADYARELTKKHGQERHAQNKESKRQERRERVEKAGRAIGRFGRIMGFLPPRPDLDLPGSYEDETEKQPPVPLRQRAGKRLGDLIARVSTASQPRTPEAAAARQQEELLRAQRDFERRNRR